MVLEKIDAILVYKTTTSSTERDIFLNNLKQLKLQLEFERATTDDTIIFIKIYAPTDVLLQHAKKHGISIKMEQLTILQKPPVHLKFMKTILNDPNPNPEDPIVKRAWNVISKLKPNELTTAERSKILFSLMDYVKFGDHEFDTGLPHLLHNNVFISAFPIHDGPWEWSDNENETLNERQLLAQYWANFKEIFKQQPLNTIENYFGYEIGMYFGWMGFYNKMLILASILGIFAFLYGLCVITIIHPVPITEACTSEIYICPRCKFCKPKRMKDFCKYFYYAYINDNPGSIIYAILISFWATIFVELWKREKTILMTRWEAKQFVDNKIRPEYLANVKSVRIHKYTGELELYIPFKKQIIQTLISVIGVAIMVIIVLLCLFCIIVYEWILKWYNVKKIYIMITSSVLTVLVMMSLRKVYVIVATKLTDNELPKTQLDFDKSFMCKMVIFTLVNNYGKLLYLAFFKGIFFTYPGDPEVLNSLFPISFEECDPMGCISDVFLLLATIVIMKPLVFKVLKIFIPMYKVWKRNKEIKGNVTLPIWEENYNLNKMERFSIMNEFEELIVQFGFITFFIAAFPLAPLFALLNNILEMRIDSRKLTKYFRRPIIRRATSIDIWFELLQAMAFVAVITNALFIALTSNIIPSAVYFYEIDRSLVGYLNYTLSKFAVTDNYWPYLNETECYYVGFRNPPEHKNPYELAHIHYYLMTIKLTFAISFTVIVLLFTSLVAYMIPDIPQSIKDLMLYNEKKAKGF